MSDGLSGKNPEIFWKKIINGWKHFTAVCWNFHCNIENPCLWELLIIFALSIVLAVILGIENEFIPPEDQGNFIVRMEAPIDYSVDQVEKYFGDTEKMIKEIPGVKSVFYVQGYQGYTNKARMMVTLQPKAERKKTQEDIKKIARMKLKQIPGMKASAEDISLIRRRNQAGADSI